MPSPNLPGLQHVLAGYGCFDVNAPGDEFEVVCAIGALQATDDILGAIWAVVVHDHHFKINLVLCQDVVDQPEDKRDVVFLVVRGQHDRVLVLGHRVGCEVRCAREDWAYALQERSFTMIV